MDILEIIQDNGFLVAVVKLLKNDGYSCTKCIDDKVYYLRAHQSGRDFYEEIPLNYITNAEMNSLVETIVEDLEYAFNDYDWEDLDYEEVSEALYDESENFFGDIIVAIGD